MITARSLITELLAFTQTAPASQVRDALVDKAKRFRRAQRARQRTPQPPLRSPAVDRLPGIIAAAAYLLDQNRPLSLNDFCAALNKQTQIKQR